MESYGKIMNLVEEVRDILHLHEQDDLALSKKQKAKIHARIKASHSPEAGHHPNPTQHVKNVMKGIKSGHAAATAHNPFKNIRKGKHLGGTSGEVAKKRGPSTTTPGSKKKQWRCRCHSYHCLCTGKGDENKGEIKHVEIRRDYKKEYNKNYKAWRAKHAQLFAPGGERGFKKPKKPHHKGYHEQ